MNLTHMYRSVLKKCAFINAAIVIGAIATTTLPANSTEMQGDLTRRWFAERGDALTLRSAYEVDVPNTKTSEETEYDYKDFDFDLSISTDDDYDPFTYTDSTTQQNIENHLDGLIIDSDGVEFSGSNTIISADFPADLKLNDRTLPTNNTTYNLNSVEALLIDGGENGSHDVSFGAGTTIISLNGGFDVSPTAISGSFQNGWANALFVGTGSKANFTGDNVCITTDWKNGISEGLFLRTNSTVNFTSVKELNILASSNFGALAVFNKKGSLDINGPTTTNLVVKAGSLNTDKDAFDYSASFTDNVFAFDQIDAGDNKTKTTINVNNATFEIAGSAKYKDKPTWSAAIQLQGGTLDITANNLFVKAWSYNSDTTNDRQDLVYEVGIELKSGLFTSDATTNIDVYKTVGIADGLYGDILNEELVTATVSTATFKKPLFIKAEGGNEGRGIAWNYGKLYIDNNLDITAIATNPDFAQSLGIRNKSFIKIGDSLASVSKVNIYSKSAKDSIGILNATEINYHREDGGKIGFFNSDVMISAVSTSSGNVKVYGIENQNGSTIEFENSRVYVSASGGKDDTIGIVNDGSINFRNSRVSVPEGIKNNGSISFFDNVTFDGTITGRDTVGHSGIVNFSTFATNVGSFNLTLDEDLNVPTIKANSVKFSDKSNISLLVPNLVNGKHEFISAVTLTGLENVSILENSLYNISLNNDGSVNISMKSNDDINRNIDVPISSDELNALEKLYSPDTNRTELGKKVSEQISFAMQNHNYAKAVQGVRDLVPTTSQAVNALASTTNTLLNNVANNRMNFLGKSSGDNFANSSVWVKALYNYSDQKSSGFNSGFDANTEGVVLGFDSEIKENLLFGIGYAYTKSDVDTTDNKDIDVDGHNIFVYAGYQPSDWYINTVISYAHSEYDEEKNPMNVKVDSNYKSNVFAVNLMTGYNTSVSVVPEFGLRYLYVDQESYSDGIQKIDSDVNNNLTGVLGLKYSPELRVDSTLIKPTMRLSATYDFVSDNSKSNVTIIGDQNLTYQIRGDRLSRFGIEAGVGLTTSMNGWDLSLDYDAGFRKGFHTHTGSISAKHHF